MVRTRVLKFLPYSDQSVIGLLVIKYNLKTYWWPHSHCSEMISRDYSSHGNVVKSILTSDAIDASKTVSEMLQATAFTEFDRRPHHSFSCQKDGINKTAICLMGIPGSWRTVEALRHHVLEVLFADLFIISPRNVSAFNPLRSLTEPYNIKNYFDVYAPKWSLSAAVNVTNYLSGLPGAHPGSGSYQVASRWICSQLIKYIEYKKGMRYDFIGVGRLDLMWMKDHPSIKPKGCWIPYPTNDWGGYCDYDAFCSRNAATVILENPLLSIPLSFGTNTEGHLKAVLQKSNIRVERSNDTLFFRSCANFTIGHCLYSKKLGMSGKLSGGQMTPFL